MDLDIIARIAEQKITEAIEEGKFDNLPGKGLPLVFDEDMSIPAHIRLANKVLKNAGVAPEWVQFRQDILDERKVIENLFVSLPEQNRKWQRRLESLKPVAGHPLLATYASWHRKSRERYLSTLKSVNTSILKFSMHAPAAVSGGQPFASYKIEAEMARFDSEFAHMSGLPDAEPVNRRAESTLRSSARSRYDALGNK